MSHGVGHGHGSDLTLLWLWYRLVATALTRPLPSLGTSLHQRCGPKRTKKKKKKQ